MRGVMDGDFGLREVSEMWELVFDVCGIAWALWWDGGIR